MALEDILETIRADSRATVDSILAEAEKAAGEIREAARVEAAREETRLAASLDDRARMESRRRVSRARLEGAALRREARERVYGQARAGLRERLETLRSSSHYREILSDLYEEALAVLPAAEAVRVDPADLELIRAIISEHPGSPRVEGEEMPLGGLTLVAEKQAVDNTIESRLERADGYLRDVAGTVVPGLRGEAR
ncbi:MAG TPA: V-type ATP synthase subunit E [Acidimicrobiia bacterium]|nr:V-type ATP synthase subunit E [Acidimicrobiia bacterium]